MKRSTDRILTTHAGSLPRPHDLLGLIDAVENGTGDEQTLRRRVRSAVGDVVTRQREIGVDVISDGEMGKLGFSNYIYQRDGGQRSAEHEMVPIDFRPMDLAGMDQLAYRLSPADAWARIKRPATPAPVQPRDAAVIRTEIEDLAAALGDDDHDAAFVGAITPGHLVFQFPNEVYATRDEYLRAAIDVLAPEYRAIVDAGFNLQLDSPDAAMACHCIMEGDTIEDPLAHVSAGVDALNQALAGIPAEKIRLHVCWGNYGGPHHRDVELRQILPALLCADVGFISFEAANPRHEHEYEVWREIPLPDDMAMIPGVIDTNTNRVEHPRLVAQRLERFAEIVGRERVIAGTDCGFETFLGMQACDPQVAWLKLESLVEGARLASERLWSPAVVRE